MYIHPKNNWKPCLFCFSVNNLSKNVQELFQTKKLRGFTFQTALFGGMKIFYCRVQCFFPKCWQFVLRKLSTWKNVTSRFSFLLAAMFSGLALVNWTFKYNFKAHLSIATIIKSELTVLLFFHLIANFVVCFDNIT